MNDTAVNKSTELFPEEEELPFLRKDSVRGFQDSNAD